MSAFERYTQGYETSRRLEAESAAERARKAEGRKPLFNRNSLLALAKQGKAGVAKFLSSAREKAVPAILAGSVALTMAREARAQQANPDNPESHRAGDTTIRPETQPLSNAQDAKLRYEAYQKVEQLKGNLGAKPEIIHDTSQDYYDSEGHYVYVPNPDELGFIIKQSGPASFEIDVSHIQNPSFKEGLAKGQIYVLISPKKSDYSQNEGFNSNVPMATGNFVTPGTNPELFEAFKHPEDYAVIALVRIAPNTNPQAKEPAQVKQFASINNPDATAPENPTEAAATPQVAQKPTESTKIVPGGPKTDQERTPNAPATPVANNSQIIQRTDRDTTPAATNTEDPQKIQSTNRDTAADTAEASPGTATPVAPMVTVVPPATESTPTQTIYPTTSETPGSSPDATTNPEPTIAPLQSTEAAPAAPKNTKPTPPDIFHQAVRHNNNSGRSSLDALLGAATAGTTIFGASEALRRQKESDDQSPIHSGIDFNDTPHRHPEPETPTVTEAQIDENLESFWQKNHELYESLGINDKNSPLIKTAVAWKLASQEAAGENEKEAYKDPTASYWPESYWPDRVPQPARFGNPPAAATINSEDNDGPRISDPVSTQDIWRNWFNRATEQYQNESNPNRASTAAEQSGPTVSEPQNPDNQNIGRPLPELTGEKSQANTPVPPNVDNNRPTLVASHGGKMYRGEEGLRNLREILAEERQDEPKPLPKEPEPTPEPILPPARRAEVARTLSEDEKEFLAELANKPYPPVAEMAAKYGYLAGTRDLADLAKVKDWADQPITFRFRALIDMARDAAPEGPEVQTIPDEVPERIWQERRESAARARMSDRQRIVNQFVRPQIAREQEIDELFSQAQKPALRTPTTVQSARIETWAKKDYKQVERIIRDNKNSRIEEYPAKLRDVIRDYVRDDLDDLKIEWAGLSENARQNILNEIITGKFVDESIRSHRPHSITADRPESAEQPSASPNDEQEDDAKSATVEDAEVETPNADEVSTAGPEDHNESDAEDNSPINIEPEAQPNSTAAPESAEPAHASYWESLPPRDKLESLNQEHYDALTDNQKQFIKDVMYHEHLSDEDISAFRQLIKQIYARDPANAAQFEGGLADYRDLWPKLFPDEHQSQLTELLYTHKDSQDAINRTKEEHSAREAQVEAQLTQEALKQMLARVNISRHAQALTSALATYHPEFEHYYKEMFRGWREIVHRDPLAPGSEHQIRDYLIHWNTVFQRLEAQSNPTDESSKDAAQNGSDEETDAIKNAADAEARGLTLNEKETVDLLVDQGAFSDKDVSAMVVSVTREHPELRPFDGEMRKDLRNLQENWEVIYPGMRRTMLENFCRRWNAQLG